ncbi:L,D-transpeptidase family protein [Motilimonas eburnea]|uniref:L,D-transpeptidase family protein n=1 Tax=Motilimonas eburnea TaxID=1737488 RepID=UPI001E567D50|nr:L,D-transpeptidase family protein [Motilimonas eburnea]MCE2571035.1 L,D-transpeptidase family protein [Motilimonas eburnea]
MAISIKTCLYLLSSLLVLIVHVPQVQASNVDKVLVIKSARTMYLLNNGRILQKYDISLGKRPEGHKKWQGDKRTPEGRYVLDFRNPESNFFRSIHINYPNEQDLAYAEKKGYDPGGAIYIHGLPNGKEHLVHKYKGTDWTDGCIAVLNEQMLEIWNLVADGTEIEIRP